MRGTETIGLDTFKSGETYRTTNAFLCPGYISSGATAIFFTIYLPKRIPSGMRVSVSGNCAIRHTGGGYLLDGSITSAGTLSYVFKDNALRVQITASSAFSGATNNTPVIVQCSGENGLTITFS